jgi:quercetin dioxygenase-like cupin family protein
MATRASVTARLRGHTALVQHWNLSEIETPDGSRSPAVLHSQDGESRVVLIELSPGQELSEHQVTEAALLLVVSGHVQVETAAESVDAGAGELFRFDPAERHSVSSPDGARVLLTLSPWPGQGHYRGDTRAGATASS